MTLLVSDLIRVKLDARRLGDCLDLGTVAGIIRTEGDLARGVDQEHTGPAADVIAIGCGAINEVEIALQVLIDSKE